MVAPTTLRLERLMERCVELKHDSIAISLCLTSFHDTAVAPKQIMYSRHSFTSTFDDRNHLNEEEATKRIDSQMDSNTYQLSDGFE